MLITNSTIWFVNSYKESVGCLGQLEPKKLQRRGKKGDGLWIPQLDSFKKKHSTAWSQRDLDPPKVQIHSLFFEELQWWCTCIKVLPSDELKSASLRALWMSFIVCNNATQLFLDDDMLSWIFSYLIIGPHSPNTWDAANIDLHLHSTQTQLVRHYDSCFLKNLQYKIHV